MVQVTVQAMVVQKGVQARGQILSHKYPGQKSESCLQLGLHVLVCSTGTGCLSLSGEFPRDLSNVFCLDFKLSQSSLISPVVAGCLATSFFHGWFIHRIWWHEWILQGRVDRMAKTKRSMWTDTTAIGLCRLVQIKVKETQTSLW